MDWLDVPWCTKVPQSPHCSNRGGFKINCIGLHYTAGGSPQGTLKWFSMPQSDASAHFVVGRKGEIYQCVPLSQRAWHFGQASLEYEGFTVSDRPDRCAIGIEISNYGDLVKYDNKYYFQEIIDDVHKYDVDRYGQPVEADLEFFSSGVKIHGFWEPYTTETVDAVVKLCSLLVKEFSIPLHRIVGHEDVAMPIGRKVDPGPAWNWEMFVDLLCKDLGVGIPDDMWKLHKTVRL